MTEDSFLPKKYSKIIKAGEISCQSPSNIALVKYWGKYGEQLPQNASVSFTLTNCNTKTTLYFTKKDPSNEFDFEVYLDGLREIAFEPKVNKFFERIEKYVSFLKDYTFKIETTNSFPHSSGIASSASGMSALAIALVAMEQRLIADDMSNESMHQKASFLARLGSGSAARSIQGPLVVWGAHPEINGSSNLFGVPYAMQVDSVFENYQDTILLVDKGEKQVSSTVGHDLMHGHPYADKRFKEANNNLSKLISIFKTGDIPAFIEIVESEALQLHAMMMASKPYFILMKPNTLEIINRIWEYRKNTQSNVCFTLDAGANVHVLYPEAEKEQVQDFIATQLADYCKNGEYIHDQAGLGATLL